MLRVEEEGSSGWKEEPPAPHSSDSSWGLMEMTAESLSKALQVQIQPGTFKWRRDGLSKFIRMEFQKTRVMGEEDSEGDCHLIAKFLGGAENGGMSPVVGAMNSRAQTLHLNEIRFYERIVPELVAEVPELRDYFCPFLYGSVGGQDEGGGTLSALLLQDLRAEGYERKPFHIQIPYEDFDDGIRFLAKLHFAGWRVEGKKRRRLDEVYPWLRHSYLPTDTPTGTPTGTPAVPTTLNNPPKERKTEKEERTDGLGFQESFPAAFDRLETFLPETHRHAFLDLKGSAGKMLEKVLKGGQEFPTTIHGSLWQNNLLVHQEDEKTAPTTGLRRGGRVKVVDWEMMGYADPLFDLAIYILTSFPEEELSIMSLELTVLRYTEEFNSLLAQTEADGSLPKLRTDFHQNLEFLNTFGLAYAFIWATTHAPSILKRRENEERLLRIFKFLHDDMDLPAFLYSLLL